MKSINHTPVSIYPPRLPQQLSSGKHLAWIEPSGDLSIAKLVFVIALNSLFWYGIDIGGQVASWVLISFVILLVLTSFYLISRLHLVNGLMIIMYLAVLQPAIRANAPQLPYLFLEYITPVWVFLIMRNYRRNLRFSLPLIFYGLYLLLEITGLVESESLKFARAVLIPSLILFLFLLLASNIQITPAFVRNLLLAYLIGVSGIAAIISRVYLTGEHISWFNASNFSTSGDMGPVQVSMILSIGAFLCILFIEAQSHLKKLFFGLFAALLSYLMLLTFSRNGLYILAIAIVSNFFLFTRFKFANVILFVIFILIGNLLFQKITEQTGGLAVERYSDISSTNRTTLAKYGWQIFLDHPFWGVGTGNYYHVVSDPQYFGMVSGAHNEFVRAASEHGIFGIVFWLLFVVTSVVTISREPDAKTKSFRITFFVVSIAYMFVNGLKLFIQPPLFFLALASFKNSYNSTLQEQ